MRGDGGVYGRIAWTGLTCYAIGILVQIPFVNIYPIGGWSGYVSPVASALNGADLSWLVGIAVTAPLYYIVERRHSARIAYRSTSFAVGEAELGPEHGAPEDLLPRR